MSQEQTKLFENRLTFPDPDARRRLAALVGMAEKRSRLAKILALLVNPKPFQDWAAKHYPDANKAVSMVLQRPPLVVLAGDVGSGKTELAETIGDDVSLSEDIPITCHPLSLAARGEGQVGQMTQLISTAFDEVIAESKKYVSPNKKSRGAAILLIDEADALAQSREAKQMHHEDRAGVNAFIRGINRLGNGTLPVAVIMCTNRLTALDPAIRRRAADIMLFSRPTLDQRVELLEGAFLHLNFKKQSIRELARITGENANRSYGFTFSDLTQRLVPTILLDAYPSSSGVSIERALILAAEMIPTAPFLEA